MQAIVLLFLAFIGQAFLDGLLGNLSPPDLVYLATLTTVATVSPYLGLPLAFLFGLIQDLLSTGHPGVHAVGLLFAAYSYYRLSRLVHWDELAGQLVILVGSFLAKWLGMILILFWLQQQAFNPLTLWPVILSEMLLTLAVAPFLIQTYQNLFGVARSE